VSHRAVLTHGTQKESPAVAAEGFKQLRQDYDCGMPQAQHRRYPQFILQKQRDGRAPGLRTHSEPQRAQDRSGDQPHGSERRKAAFDNAADKQVKGPCPRWADHGYNRFVFAI